MHYSLTSIHSQAAATFQWLFCSLQSSLSLSFSLSIYTYPYRYFILCVAKSPAPTAGKGPTSTQIRLHSSLQGRIWPMKHRGCLPVRSAQQSRCAVLQMIAERSQPSASHPQPECWGCAQPFCMQKSFEAPTQRKAFSRDRPKPNLFQAPQNNIIWEFSLAPGLPPVLPQHGCTASNGQRPRGAGGSMSDWSCLNHCTSLP